MTSRTAAQDETVWAVQFMAADIFTVRTDGIRDRHEFHNSYRNGCPLDPNDLPSHLTHEKNPIPKRDIFTIQGQLIVVSDRLAAMFSEYDLGPEPTPETPTPERVELQPLTLYAKNEKIQIGDVFLMQVSNHKDGWAPEESRSLTHFEEFGTYTAVVSRESLAVAKAALTGADIWRDRRLYHVVFFSGRLFGAMKSAGMTRLDSFHPCRMV